MKLKPPHKRHVKIPEKHIRARSEDNVPVRPVIIKSPSRRYERPDARPGSQTLSNRPPEYGGES